MPIDLIIVRLLRSLAEVAGYFMLGQGILHLLSGRNRAANPIYRLFQLLTSPVYKLTRAITPKVVADQHVPFIAFALVFWIWVSMAMVKRYLCALHNLDCGF